MIIKSAIIPISETKIKRKRMAKELVIRHDSEGFGFGMYVNDKPWNFFKYGDCVIAHTKWIIKQGFTSVKSEGPISEDKREEDFA